ncbi:uncharacterized protein DFL_004490 [Arthrobotrys flagrans]|uniref:FAD-binding domain-containing protein n=1 Tax=Arthrobotrys flagrans TaxID=97331 RepID=A0A437A4S0_ARTFL|nr:hypothetical protein DFL_004490 [Arthrobotrys flagrans]
MAFPKIIIIGSGLSGLSLSLFLTRLLPTASIKIYEVRPSTHPSTSGTINLTPNALRVLDHLGIYESLIPQGFNFDNLTLLNHQFDFLASIPIAGISEFGYQSLRIERRIVHSALLRKVAERSSQIEIIYDSKCESVEESDADVTVNFTDGTSTTGDVVIACDGIHSTVRKSFVKDPKNFNPKYTGQISIGGTITKSQIQEFNINNNPYPLMMFGPESSTGANFVVWPYDRSGDKFTFFTTLSKPDEDNDGWKSYADGKELLKSIMQETFSSDGSPWNEMVKKTIELSDAEGYAFWPYYLHSIPEKFYSEKARVILIGDAAHAMPPSGGQGAAMAFEDAETLAYSLAAAFTAESGSDINTPHGREILSKWSDHRIERMKTIHEMKERMSDMRKGGSGSTSGFMFTVKVWTIWLLGFLGVLGRTRRAVNNYDARKEAAVWVGGGVMAKSE